MSKYKSNFFLPLRLQAPKLARKCEIKHWYACCADGRKVGWSVYGHANLTADLHVAMWMDNLLSFLSFTHFTRQGFDRIWKKNPNIEEESCKTFTCFSEVLI